MSWFKRYDVKIDLPERIHIESFEYLESIKVNNGEEAIKCEVKFKGLPFTYKMHLGYDWALVVPIINETLSMSEESRRNLWYWHEVFAEGRLNGSLKKVVDMYLSVKNKEAI